MRSLFAVGLILALGAPAGVQAQEKVRVAVAKVRGRKAARPEKLERGVRFGVKTVGARSIGSDALSKAAREVGVKAASAEGARAVGADYLVLIKMSRKRKKNVATAQLLRASDGKVIKKVVKSYGAGRAALKVGKAIGKALGKVAKSKGRMAPVVEPPPPPQIIAAPEPPPPPPNQVKIEESDSSNKATVTRETEMGGGDDGILIVTLAGGTQIGSAYTVTVGDAVTGLAYSLKPLFLINAGLKVRIPQVGLYFGARFDLAPVKYEVVTDPPVNPAQPGGRFLGVGGMIGYEALRLEIGDGITYTLDPVLTFGYDSLTVEQQDPVTVVISWGAIDFQGGLFTGVELFDALAIEAVFRVGYVFSYSEKPDTTGNSGAGLGLSAGARARYWIMPMFGVQVDALYGFKRIGLSGEGSRTGFMEDPPLSDATIFSADFKLGVGLLLSI